MSPPDRMNTQDERDFFAAIQNGQFDRVRELVSDNPDLLNAHDDDRFGATLDVHAAAGLGRIGDLEILLDRDPNRIAEAGGDGCQPLHFAGTVSAAGLLLERGADMEARCLDHYSTPLQYLAFPRPEVARFLSSRGAVTDIFSAVLADDRVAAGRLLIRDPNVTQDRVDQSRFPPGPDHDVQNILTFIVGHNATPLHAAAKANRSGMVDLLVQHGLSPDVRGGYDHASPLHMAAWEDHVEVAEALIKQGADVNMLSGAVHNNSAAGWAIVAGSADCFDLLMDHGAKVLDFFEKDAVDAVAGRFLKFKRVPQQNYDRILAQDSQRCIRIRREARLVTR